MKVIVDYENNSEVFWSALNAHPDLKNLPICYGAGECDVNQFQLETILSLPGWDDPGAPEYAPHPLILECEPANGGPEYEISHDL